MIQLPINPYGYDAARYYRGATVGYSPWPYGQIYGSLPYSPVTRSQDVFEPRTIQSNWQTPAPVRSKPVITTEPPVKQSDPGQAVKIGLGVLGSGAALGGSYWYYKRQKNKPQTTATKETKPTETTKPIPPLLKLEDFRVPPGLETPEKRQAKTVELVNTVFPEVLEVYNNRLHDPAWKVKINKIFNDAVRRIIAPNLAINFSISPSARNSGHFFPEFRVINESEDMQKLGINQQSAYLIGGVNSSAGACIQSDSEKLEWYRLLLHETNHFLYYLARHPKIDKEERKNYPFPNMGYFLLPELDYYSPKYFNKIGLKFNPQENYTPTELKRFQTALFNIKNHPEKFAFLKGVGVFDEFNKKIKNELNHRKPDEFKSLYTRIFQNEKESFNCMVNRSEQTDQTILNLNSIGYINQGDIQDLSQAIVANELQELVQSQYHLSKEELGIFEQSNKGE